MHGLDLCIKELGHSQVVMVTLVVGSLKKRIAGLGVHRPDV